jgi:hypothetical protein
MVDHRDSPGLPEGMSRGMPMGRGMFFEAPTYSCKHCQAVVVIRRERTALRYRCQGCRSYLCDQCAAILMASGGECKTFERVIEELQEKAAKSSTG